MQLLAGAKVIEVGNSSTDRALFNGMARTKGSAGESDDNSVRATIRKIKVRMMIE